MTVRHIVLHFLGGGLGGRAGIKGKGGKSNGTSDDDNDKRPIRGSGGNED